MIHLSLKSFSFGFKKYSLPSEKKLCCVTSTQHIRPYIPKDYCTKIFQQFHELYHPGIKSTIKLISLKFVWLDMKKDIQLCTKTFVPRQTLKITHHKK